MSDDDDFKSGPSVPKVRPKVSKHPGEEVLLVESRWKGAPVVDKIVNHFANTKVCTLIPKYVTNSLKSYHSDFEFPELGPLRGLAILLLTETDYLGGVNSFKKRVAKFFGARKSQRAIVMCVRTELSATNFVEVQTFVAIEVGLVLIPVADLDKLPQLMAQLYIIEKGAKNRLNPFRFGAERKTQSADREMMMVLKTIPGLGEKKARKLLDSPKLNSMTAIAEASVSELASVIDGSAARAVHGFFNMTT